MQKIVEAVAGFLFRGRRTCPQVLQVAQHHVEQTVDQPVAVQESCIAWFRLDVQGHMVTWAKLV